jgi:hypothetical protein
LKLLLKFNLVFVTLFVLGIAASGYISWQLLQKNAQEEIAENARFMMSVALAVRSYTNTQIKPLLTTQMVYSFLPQSVPAYSAIPPPTGRRGRGGPHLQQGESDSFRISGGGRGLVLRFT